MIPKAPPRIDVATLEARLRARGIDVHRRTIQRDLVDLGRIFPLVVDFREKPFGWRWADGAEFLCSIPILRDPRGEGIEMTLCLRVERSLARTVAEGLRGRDGDARHVSVRPREDGDVDLEADVLDVCALRRWLLGFGDAVEVLSPEHVRAEFVDKAARIAARYRAA